MTPALWHLTFQLFWKRISVQVRRLRQPRYFAAAIGSGLYFYLTFFRNPALQRGVGADAALFASLFFMLSTALAWMFSSKPALVFTPAEVQFLFLAPVTRRALVQYKLMATFLNTAASSLFFTVMFRRTAAAPLFFVGTWLVLSTIGLHSVAVSLSRHNLKQNGLSGLRRQRMALAIVVMAGVMVAHAVVEAWPKLTAAHGFRELIAEMELITTSGPAGVIFWPFRALVAPALSTSVGEFARALPAVLVMFALNYVWVFRADVAFEEAAAERAVKTVERLKEGYQPPKPRNAGATPFSLAPVGRVEWAILWKNIIQTGRYTTRGRVIGTLMVFTVVLACYAIPMRSVPVADSASVVLWIVIVMFSLFGPQSVKNDFRRDLAQLAILKTWPIRGAPLVRGEILGSALPLIVLTLPCIAGLMALQSHEPEVIRVGVAALMLTPGIIGIQIVFHNAIALVFPAWVPTTPAVMVQQGIGMRYIMMIVSLIGLVLTLIPAAAIATIVGFAEYFVTPQIPVLGPALAAAITLVVECWIAAELLGGRFERMDVSAIGPAN